MGRLVAAHQLDDDVDLVVGDEVGRRIREEFGGYPGRGGPTRIADGDGGQLERSAVGRLEFAGSLEQGADHLAADRPRAEDTDAQAGAAHDLGRAGRDIRRMVADASERPPAGVVGNTSWATLPNDDDRRRSCPRALSRRPRRSHGPFPGSSRPASSTWATTSGAIRNYVRLQYEYEAIYCIVDYHALTSTHDGGVLRARTREMAASLLALGLDPERCSLFVQSHRPEVTELAWLLTTVTPVSWLERTPTYKEKKRDQPDDVNHGLLTYPVLQAADIVIYKASLVPVGKDQAAHLELTREIVRAFNSRYGDTFPEPQAVYTEAPTVLGTDGVHKMSKSLGNTIDILAAPEVIRKQVMSMVTDTQADPAHRPGPPRGLQRLPAPARLRRRLRDRCGRASGRRGPAAST